MAEIFTEGSQTQYSLTKVCELFAGISVHNEIANCEPLYDEVSDILYEEANPTFSNALHLFSAKNLKSTIGATTFSQKEPWTNNFEHSEESSRTKDTNENEKKSQSI